MVVVRTAPVAPVTTTRSPPITGSRGTAIGADSELREGAQIAEITGLVPDDSYLEGTPGSSCAERSRTRVRS